MKRRTFLKVTAGGLVVVSTVGGVAVYRSLESTFTNEQLAQQIRRNLSYLDLRISDAQCLAFVQHFAEREGPIERHRSDIKVGLIGGQTSSWKLVKMLSIFLKSTNFFPNGADVSKPVTFVNYYDPYEVPCGNPIVRNW